MSLTEAAFSRKERLLALRKRKAGEIETDGVENEQSGGVRLKQRNFDPETRTLRKHIPSEVQEDTVEKNVEGLAEQIIVEDAERREQELDLLNIAPKRPNWDLKREMERKLAKLERKTTEAIHTLIRQRIVAQKGGENDLVGALNAHEKGREADGDSDDE
ncbi:mRNA splicing factor [Hysterangium stoloniferum]|nr:mRNA splicing factor [Hysterangium stoloniferum]